MQITKINIAKRANAAFPTCTKLTIFARLILGLKSIPELLINLKRKRSATQSVNSIQSANKYQDPDRILRHRNK